VAGRSYAVKKHEKDQKGGRSGRTFLAQQPGNEKLAFPFFRAKKGKKEQVKMRGILQRKGKKKKTGERGSRLRDVQLAQKGKESWGPHIVYSESGRGGI